MEPSNLIHESAGAYIFSRLENQTLVTVKVLNTPDPSPQQIARFENEYHLTRHLRLPGIRRAFRKESIDGRRALILAYVAGVPLAEAFSAKKISIPVFLNIAAQAADILSRLHGAGIIHRDINGKNFIFSGENQRITLIDFEHAKRLDDPQEDALPLGTLAYLSPEQTGRVNRPINERSDLYSLGITLYELIGGRLPFQAADASAWVHAHLAQTPPLVHTLPDNRLEEGTIPETISRMIDILLRKDPDRRYPSAGALLEDINSLAAQWADTGKFTQLPFEQGVHSLSLKQVNQLFGRDTELRTLEALCHRVREGGMEVTVVTGEEGVGKTALVTRIRDWVQDGKGYFIEGSFDPLKNSPYHGIIAALNDFVNQALTESSGQLEFWKILIRNAVGDYGKLLTDVIPNLRLIIGEPTQPAESGIDLQHKFGWALQEMIRALSGEGHPLAVFLDGGQWMDLASQQLLEPLIEDKNNPYTWIIISHRTAGPEDEPLLVRRIMERAISPTIIRLENLTQANLEEWLSACLVSETPDTDVAAELLYDKTHGNPLFLERILRDLVRDGLLERTPAGTSWVWNLAALRRLDVSENVVDLMASRLASLPDAVKTELELAAVLGVEFPLEGIRLLKEVVAPGTGPSLDVAIREGLLLDISSVKSLYLAEGGQQVLKFAHDGIRRAVYESMTAQRRQGIHLAIARIFEKKLPEESRDEYLFDVINHWNQAKALIQSREEKKTAAELNLIAGRRATAAGAYHAALDYFRIGSELLGSFSWEQFYRLNLDLHTGGAEAAYLAGDFSIAAAFSQRVEKQAFNLIDRVQIWDLQLRSLVAKNQLSEASELGINLLERLGYYLPRRPKNMHYLIARLRTALAAWYHSPEKLAQGAEIQDGKVLAALQVIEGFTPAVVVRKPALAPLVVYLEAYLTFRYGKSSFTPKALINYGLVAALGEKRPQKGYEIAAFGLRLFQENPQPERLASAYLTFYGNLWPLKNRLHEAAAPLLEAFHAGMRSGDLTSGALALIQFAHVRLMTGSELSAFAEELATYRPILRQRQMQSADVMLAMAAQLVEHLRVSREQPFVLEGTFFKESETLPRLQQAHSKTEIQTLFFFKAVLAYHFDHVPEAIAFLRHLDELRGKEAGPGRNLFVLFQSGLMYAAAYPHQTEAERVHSEAKIEQAISLLRAAAQHCPENYQHTASLLQAEWYRVQGISEQTRVLYEKAIESAREHEFLNDEALACELLGKYYREQNAPFLAEAYLTRALRLYERMGATAKVAFLASRYPRFLGRNTRTLLETGSTSSSSSGKWSGIDLESITKASQALAGEVVLSSLMDKLLRIVMENAGAEKVVVLEMQENELSLVAKGNSSGLVEVMTKKPIPFKECDEAPHAMVYFAARTGKPLVFDNVLLHPEFRKDAYITHVQPLSVLCFPITHKGSLTGMLYLENNLTEGAFTEERVEIIRVLSAQMAISLENARLYENLDEKVRARTFQLNRKNEELAHTLSQLQSTQSQLLQSEKMASLGQLTAGIAHEINNPINFISGNVSPLTRNVEELRQLYERVKALPHQPDLGKALQELDTFRKQIDADFLFEEIDMMLTGIRDGAIRTQQIVAGLQHFSRSDESRFRPLDIHEGIESTLTLLNNKIKDRITLVRNYGTLPPVEGLPGKLNQAFMNILSNGIQAIGGKGQLTITTGVQGEEAYIFFRDSGPGVPEELKNRIFEPFFTTKEVGQGTGLGLSITYGIIEQHKGRIEVDNPVGGGAEFRIFIPISHPPDEGGA